MPSYKDTSHLDFVTNNDKNNTYHGPWTMSPNDSPAGTNTNVLSRISFTKQPFSSASNAGGNTDTGGVVAGDFVGSTVGLAVNTGCWVGSSVTGAGVGDVVGIRVGAGVSLVGIIDKDGMTEIVGVDDGNLVGNFVGVMLGIVLGELVFNQQLVSARTFSLRFG